MNIFMGSFQIAKSTEGDHEGAENIENGLNDDNEKSEDCPEPETEVDERLGQGRWWGQGGRWGGWWGTSCYGRGDGQACSRRGGLVNCDRNRSDMRYEQTSLPSDNDKCIYLSNNMSKIVFIGFHLCL